MLPVSRAMPRNPADSTSFAELACEKLKPYKILIFIGLLVLLILYAKSSRVENPKVTTKSFCLSKHIPYFVKMDLSVGDCTDKNFDDERIHCADYCDERFLRGFIKLLDTQKCKKMSMSSLASPQGSEVVKQEMANFTKRHRHPVLLSWIAAKVANNWSSYICRATKELDFEDKFDPKLEKLISDLKTYEPPEWGMGGDKTTAKYIFNEMKEHLSAYIICLGWEGLKTLNKWQFELEYGIEKDNNPGKFLQGRYENWWYDEKLYTKIKLVGESNGYSHKFNLSVYEM